MKQIIEFPTHHLVVEQVQFSSFIRVTNYVEGKAYHDMVNAILKDSNASIRYVIKERKLLNNFFRSLLSIHFSETVNINCDVPQFAIFSEEIDYYHFCVDNNIPFEENEWFNTSFIKVEFNRAIDFLNNASCRLVAKLYPELSNNIKYKFINYSELFPEEKPRCKCSPDLYKKFLTENQIERLYHFSSRENKPSIEKIGICSIDYLTSNNIRVHYASTDLSREIDRRKKLTDYIHLSFERHNPMLFVALSEGRLSDFIIWGVSPEVLFWNDTLYTNKNAAKNDAIISSDINFLLNIPFKKFHNKPYNINSEYEDYYKSEVLVKKRIPNKYISEEI